jgi:multiple sugar transport system ATP-binding protein
MSQVEIKNICRHFGEIKAVDRVNLATREGEFLVLLGPSGCGKTTLLRMIAGIEEPTSGDIIIGGKIVTHLPPRVRNIAMVFQSYALYPHMSVYKNIAFPLHTRGMEKSAIPEKVKWAAKMFGIGHLLDRKPRELSGGERQRVALARAMVREPSVFLLDEPLSNLDAKLRTAAREELQQFQKNIGITTIYVTHDQVEAMGLGDRIVVMSKGMVRQIGTPRDVYQNPADTFVATFLGSPPMNIIDREGVLVGFRPESFLPLEVSSAESRLETLSFDVTWIEDLGGERLVYGNVECPCTHRHVISKLSARIPFMPEKGRKYTFALREEDIRYFDRDTGLCIPKDSIMYPGRRE